MERGEGMRAWQVGFIFVLIGTLVACSDSDDDLTGPNVLDVGGVWTGNATLTSASGAGCAGDTLSVLVGLSYPVTVELEQTDFLLTGVQVSGLPIDGGDGTSCTLSGAVTDTGFTLSSDDCVIDPIEDTSCLDGSRRDLTLLSVTLNATVNGDQADGDTTSTWETTDSMTGASTGTLTVNADFSLSR